ncbi:GPI transamidase component PIG-S [Euwallacea similis]|uniref:GPI transamidase component PIG-S n=1 Tax=Euwallacea similis TaxID=1736056 RepID=UPI00344B989D
MSIMTKSETPAKESDKVETLSDIPEQKFRTLSVISYFIVLVILGIPIWWYTTRVYRATLPLDDIYNLQIKPKTSKDFGLPLSLDYDILISFVHPSPETLNIKVDALEIDQYLQSFLEKLSPVSSFTVKSQWLYLTELGAIPRKVLDHYALLENQLPHVITPLETKLWTHMSPRPSINLVTYFPHCTSPLYIYNSNNEMSSTNAFVSPRWGGIYIMNPDKSSCELGEFHADAKLTSSTFQSLLQELFYLNSTSQEAINMFQLDRIEEMLQSSKRTLISLAQLLSEISSIVISDMVANKISVALESVKEAESFLAKGDESNALEYAKLAFRNSEEAFVHPSLLALLYFPDDQKYAIYIPLFLPVMIPVIMSLIHLAKKKGKNKRKTE